MDIGIANLLLVAITCLVLFYYTRETYRLRKATEAQIELQLRPYLIFERDELGYNEINGTFCPTGFRAILKNIGNGPALNIHISDFSLKSYNKHNRIDVMLTSIKKNILSRESGEIIAFTIENGERGTNISDNSLEDISYFITSIVIEYKDIKNNKYITKTEYGNTQCTWWDVNYEDL